MESGWLFANLKDLEPADFSQQMTREIEEDKNDMLIEKIDNLTKALEKQLKHSVIPYVS